MNLNAQLSLKLLKPLPYGASTDAEHITQNLPGVKLAIGQKP
ncbi:hypothetical protein PCH70_45930 [Pseudomonas cichorii JBC1]|nr:hypothetical protein PCH70_45930 [Pseudomonas cichorii JBC1]